jgi:hypothetical protein
MSVDTSGRRFMKSGTGQALDLVDDEDIELGVIDLDDLQRILGMICRPHRPEAIGGCLRSFPIPQQSLRAEGADPRLNRPAGYRLHAAAATLMGDMADHRGNRRLLPGAINAFDRLLDETLALRIEAVGCFVRAGWGRDQSARHRLRAVGRDQAIDPSALQAQLLRSGLDRGQRQSRLAGKWPDHRLAAQRFLPRCFGDIMLARTAGHLDLPTEAANIQIENSSDLGYNSIERG